ncbi:MAG: MBL fold metallo-hydrolase, partial [Kiritimatiellaeota bacterium]|nr:MBL fold metallo-hydrolase [Kiritimatiellota bacterium]
MKWAILSSGSMGNAMVVTDGTTRLLVDVGLSAKQITERLHAVGIPPETLTAICLTHDHADHVCGARVFCSRHQLPVYATHGTYEAVADALGDYAHWNIFAAGNPFTVGTLTVTPFATPHDAGEPVGYVFASADRSLGLLTDAGHVPEMIKHHLRSCHALILESNHDLEMLMRSGRPWHLIDRIRGRHGHLSNEQCADVLAAILPAGRL